MNDRAALDLLLAHGPLSRTRIGRLTGLSKPTASQLLARLEAAGLVEATGMSEGRPGPNAQLYAVNPRAAYAAGLDVTADRIHAAVADVTGEIVGEFRLPATPPGRGGVVRQVAGALAGAAEKAGLTLGAVHRLVIGTPGAFDPATGRLRYAAHLPGWHSPTLLDELANALPMPVAYENDVNLVALAEQRTGAARGHEDFVLLWNETGLGAALVLGGRLHRGTTGGAGEVGLMPVPGTPLVRRVAEAGAGGFQELAGARSLLRLARDCGIETGPGSGSGIEDGQGLGAGSDGPDDVPTVARLLAEAAARHTEHEPSARFLDGYAERLAIGIAALVAVLDPGLVVLAGAAVRPGGEPLRARVQEQLAELSDAQPRLVLGTVERRPVLCGALVSALAATRDEVFDTSRHPR
ncbi:ROK family transcriptional regulator [Streptomyces sp. NPDC048718]|uniref:ROK family transcriptional regulator n=1 Tax=Streptomyces sp. NPDC048718 TaxID=3365587 RepID=UPI00371CEC2D